MPFETHLLSKRKKAPAKRTGANEKQPPPGGGYKLSTTNHPWLMRLGPRGDKFCGVEGFDYDGGIIGGSAGASFRRNGRAGNVISIESIDPTKKAGPNE